MGRTQPIQATEDPSAEYLYANYNMPGAYAAPYLPLYSPMGAPYGYYHPGISSDYGLYGAQVACMIPAQTLYCPVAQSQQFYMGGAANLPLERQDVVDTLLASIDKSLADQPSCRLLQQRMDEEREAGKTGLVGRLLEHMGTKMAEHMKLPFGNYLCQKLFEQLNEAQLAGVMLAVLHSVVDLSNNLHGTRAFQKLLQRAAEFPTLLSKIGQLLEGHVCELITVWLWTTCRTSMATTSCNWL